MSFAYCTLFIIGGEYMSIIGHKKIQRDIIQAMENNKLSHAHILAGEKGIGKSELVDYFAAHILGVKDAKNHVDVGRWTLDKGKASIGVATVRSIIEECNKKPFEGDKKVIIIYNGDKITYQAQNAFLKTIEEPPANIFIFILCEDLGGILDTVKSRCCIHKLKPLNDDEMMEYLKITHKGVDESRLLVASAFSKGVPGRADDFLNNKNFEDIREGCFQLIKEVSNNNKELTLEYEKFFDEYKTMSGEILDILITIIRDIIVYKEIVNEELLINIDKIGNIKDLANVFSLGKLSDMIKVVEDTRKALKSNVNSSLAFITMVLGMQEV